MTKPLLQYQAGTVQRVLAAAGVPDTLWFPTTLARAFAVEAWNNENNGYAWISKMQAGFTDQMYHSFNPTLIIALESGVNVTAGPTTVPIRVDWEFDVVVRGLRHVQ